MSRFLKRFVILIIVAGSLSSAIFFYWQTHHYKVPSCFDAIQNQGETGIDCGGPCNSCQGKPEPLEVVAPVLIPAENNRFDIAFKLINPNTNFGAQSVDYTIKILSANGELLSSRSGQTFALPQDSRASTQGRWIIEHGVKAEANATAKVTVSNSMWQGIKENFEAPRLLILDRAYNVLTNSPEFAEAKGVLKNDSPYNFDLIELQVLLFDEDNKLMAVRRTEARTVRAAELREFRVSWRTPLPHLKKMDMMAYTNIFLNDNFVNDFGTKEKFQELNP